MKVRCLVVFFLFIFIAVATSAMTKHLKVEMCVSGLSTGPHNIITYHNNRLDEGTTSGGGAGYDFDDLIQLATQELTCNRDPVSDAGSRGPIELL